MVNLDKKKKQLEAKLHLITLLSDENVKLQSISIYRNDGKTEQEINIKVSYINPDPK